MRESGTEEDDGKRLLRDAVERADGDLERAREIEMVVPKLPIYRPHHGLTEAYVAHRDCVDPEGLPEPRRQRWWKLRVDPDEHGRSRLRGEYGMVEAPAGESQARRHILDLQIGQLGDDLLRREARRRRSSTSMTRMRSPRMQGRPPHWSGFTVIRSISSTVWPMRRSLTEGDDGKIAAMRRRGPTVRPPSACAGNAESWCTQRTTHEARSVARAARPGTPGKPEAPTRPADRPPQPTARTRCHSARE